MSANEAPQVGENATSKPGPPSIFRWVVLVVISGAMFANYYVYDSIAPIADMLKSSLGFSDENIGSLYSVYSVAAVIVLIPGGMFIDRYGTARATILFGVMATMAAALNAVTSDFYVMLVARVLLGLGSELLIVAVTCALAKWFRGKELGFAFGINLTIARLGSVAADNSPTWAADAYATWQGPLVVAAFIGILCVACPIAYGLLEKYAAGKWDLGKASETDKFVLSDLFKFGWSFWLVVLLCVTFYSAIFPFRSFAIKFFIEAHGQSRETAGFINSILPFSTMFATPLFGMMVDRVGRRSLFMAIGAFLLMPVYLIMAYKIFPLGVPIAMMGVAFSLIPAIMWPSVAYLVSEKRLGTAYAVMTLIQQVGVAGMNWLIGRTNDAFQAGAANAEGYTPGMWIFSSLGFLALIFAVLLRRAETGPNARGLETITVSNPAK